MACDVAYDVAYDINYITSSSLDCLVLNDGKLIILLCICNMVACLRCIICCNRSASASQVQMDSLWNVLLLFVHIT